MMRRLIPIVIGLLAAGCSDTVVEPSPAFIDDRPATIAGLNAAEARWRQAGIPDYVFTLRQLCFCAPSFTDPVVVRVSAGRVVDVSYQATGETVPPEARDRPLTVDDLFARLHEAVESDAEEITAQYDTALGYPTNVFVDVSRGIADEELRLEASGLTPLRP